MTRVLVTGGSGRLGRSVVTVLAEAGHEVLSVDRAATGSLPAREIEHDLLDADATRALVARERPDAVVHLAAIPVPFAVPDLDLFRTNTAMALSLLLASADAGVGAVLLASSPTVLGYGAPTGWAPRYLPLDEDHPRAPWHAYGLSKVAIEEMVGMGVARWGDRMTLGAFRPCYVLTPEEWRGAPTQLGHTIVERLRDPALAAGSLFNYVDARDAGDFVLAWLAASARVPNGTTFFVGAADALATAPLAELLPRHVPATAPVAARLTGTAPAFSSERAERLLGWRARRSWRTELAPSVVAELEGRASSHG